MPLAVFGVVLVIIIALIAVQFQEGSAFGGGGGLEGNPRIPLSLSPGGPTPGGFDPDDVPAATGVLENDTGKAADVLEFSDTGMATTPAFSTSGGLLSVRMEHYGTDQYFRIQFVTADDGTPVRGAVLTSYNKPGSYEGSRYLGVPAGDYRIEVTADGPWLLRLDYPDAKDPYYSPGNAVGAGPDSPKAVVLAEGAHTLRFEHLGGQPLEVKAWAANGTALPASSGCGTYQFQDEPKERTCRIDVQGLYYFDVQADGQWRIEF